MIRLLKNFQLSVLPVPGRLIAVIFFVLLFLIPVMTDNQFLIRMFTFTSIYTIFRLYRPGKFRACLVLRRSRLQLGADVQISWLAAVGDDTVKYSSRCSGGSTHMPPSHEAERTLPVIAYDGISSHAGGNSPGSQKIYRR